MVYIYEENLDFYEGIDNKSEFINEALKQARNKVRSDPNNIDFVRKKLAEIDAHRKSNA